MFGFGKGRIDIIIEKSEYSSGETIKGKVRLDLKKSTNADGVFINLLAEEKNQTGYGNNRSNQVRKLFDFQKPLDTGRLYTPQVYEYDFELTAPQLDRPSAPEGVLGGLVKTAMFIGGASNLVKWYLVAKLNVPGGMDVDKRVQISVHEPNPNAFRT